jgi:hypothetical protein
VVRSLGLADLTETVGGAPAFPVGVLYPYSLDIQRVCRCYDALSAASPAAASVALGERVEGLGVLNAEASNAVAKYLASVATLHSRIAFAPGNAGASVGAAYRMASRAFAP